MLLVVNLNFLLQSIDVRFQLLGHGLFHLLRKLMIGNLLLKLQVINPAQQTNKNAILRILKHVSISPNRRAAETQKSEDLGDPGLELHGALVVVGGLVDDGVQEAELLLPVKEEVDEGAEDVDDAARAGAEEIGEREILELDGLEEGPRLVVEAQHPEGLRVVLRVVQHLQLAEP